jgi:signal transduction histidine kinase
MADRRLAEDLATLIHDALNQFQVSQMRIQMGETQLVKAREAGEAAAELLREALAVAARLMIPARDRVELGAVVEKVATELVDVLGTGIEVHVALGPGKLWTHVDQRDLVRALMNLARNAAQAMPHGGALTLATTLQAEGQMVCIQVRDSGAGMDADTQARIWEPGFSTNDTSDRPRGLGLFQVKKFVEGHGGTVRVQSKVGEGTCIEMCFPRVLEAPA